MNLVGDVAFHPKRKRAQKCLKFRCGVWAALQIRALDLCPPRTRIFPCAAQRWKAIAGGGQGMAVGPCHHSDHGGRGPFCRLHARGCWLFSRGLNLGPINC